MKLLLGITASIAAYKSAELIRLLCRANVEVQVVMTQGATEFISPLTLQVLSHKPVYADLWDQQFESQIGHIQLARWPDRILIAPASANFIACLTHGMANDLLTTICLASNSPIAIAPAMNTAMWEATITQTNIQRLRQRNVSIIDPTAGEQACGEIGMGCLIHPETLLQWVLYAQQKTMPFKDTRILITAGPTREPLDPVRYLTNRSSGKMGYAIAEAASQLGAKVTLVSGPTTLSISDNITRINVTTAQQMHDAVITQLPCDIFIGVAAVADYTPHHQHQQKIKRSQHGNLTLTLKKTPDILKAVSSSKPSPLIVGFSAETENTLSHSKAKLQYAGMDLCIANTVGENKGFDADEHEVTILTQSERIPLARAAKSTLAYQILLIIAKQMN